MNDSAFAGRNLGSLLVLPLAQTVQLRATIKNCKKRRPEGAIADANVRLARKGSK